MTTQEVKNNYSLQKWSSVIKEQIIACPVLNNASEDPLHIPIIAIDVQGVVLCEQMKLLDLRVRGYKKLTELKIDDIMNITDAIQSIFDYFPFGK